MVPRLALCGFCGRGWVLLLQRAFHDYSKRSWLSSWRRVVRLWGSSGLGPPLASLSHVLDAVWEAGNHKCLPKQLVCELQRASREAK